MSRLTLENAKLIAAAALAKGDALGLKPLGVLSRKIGEMAEARPSFIAAVGAIAAGGVVPTAGGVIVLDEAGAPIGAVA